MRRYAEDTTVSVEQSKADIERLLIRYGAAEYQSGWRAGEAIIAFRLRELLIRFVLPIPNLEDDEFKWRMVRKVTKPATENQRYQAWEKERRRRWRSLYLVVKAKLEAVDCKISTLEQEFLGFVVLPNGETMFDWVRDEVLPMISAGRQPMLALAAKPEPRLVTAEDT